MRRLEIVNGPNNNFYGIRNKGQYGNQLYADLIQELTEYGATLEFEVHASSQMGKVLLLTIFRNCILKQKKQVRKFLLFSILVLTPITAMH